MSAFGYRRELSKYESIDEDELLASLSAEELKELERELEDIEPNRSLPVGMRQKSLTEKTPTGNFSREALMAYWEKETKKLLEKERLGECDKGKKSSQNHVLKEIKSSLKTVPEKKMEESSRPSTPQRSLHDSLMDAIRGSSIRQLKRVSNLSPAAQIP
uniref:Leiomodin 2 n=1 Tax=Ornithorhynchus anatinus TaxID=9258 RepID=A0A6I8N2B2_ORNAN